MKRIASILITALLTTATAHSQTLDVIWSDPVFANKNVEQFEKYGDENSKYVYAFFVDDIWPTKKVKIVAYDIETMKEVSSIIVHDKKNKINKAASNASYEIIAFENTIYLFWIMDKSNETYFQSFDAQLKPLKEMEKLYPNNYLIYHKKTENNLFLLYQHRNSANRELTVKYKIVNENLKSITEKEIILPIFETGKQYNSDYKLGVDGNLHIMSSSFNKKNHPIYTVVNIQSGKYKSYPINFVDKKIYDIGFIENENFIKLYGLFSDSKRKKSEGIFQAKIDSKTLEEVGNNHFIKFNTLQLEKLEVDKSEFHEDVGIVIENAILHDNQLVLYCSYFGFYDDAKHYLSTNAGSDPSMEESVTKYAKKSNVSVIRINDNNTLDWISVIKRDAKYLVTYEMDKYPDVKVIHEDDKAIIIYGNDYASENNDISYSLLNINSGKFEEKKHNVQNIQKAEEKKKDFKKRKKYFNPSQVEGLLKNYTFSSRVTNYGKNEETFYLMKLVTRD